MGRLNSTDLEVMRERMVLEQIRFRGITDQQILDVFLKVPRHLFVNSSMLDEAYDDTPLPIADNQTISQPYIVAYMIEILQIKKTDRVLEIGTGSGYQTAILAELAGNVYTVEVRAVLYDSASRVLNSMEYSNIQFLNGDGYQGWPEFAPYDKIIVTAAPDQIPQMLLDQLNDPGIIVIPIGTHLQYLYKIEKQNGQLIKNRLIGVRFVPMKQRWSS